MDEVNIQLLKIAEDIIQHLPNNIQTKYFKLKTKLITDATEQVKLDRSKSVHTVVENQIQTEAITTDEKGQVTSARLPVTVSVPESTQQLSVDELSVKPVSPKKLQAAVQTSNVQNESTHSQFFQHQLSELSKVNDQLSNQNSQLLSKIQEMNKTIEQQQRDISELKQNQKLVKQIISGIINKISGTPVVTNNMNISQLLTHLNEQINIFNDHIYNTQVQIQNQNRENAEVILNLKKKIDSLDQLNKQNQAFQTSAKQVSIQCLNQLKSKSDEQIQRLQVKLADLFQQLQKLKRYETYSNDVSGIFEGIASKD